MNLATINLIIQILFYLTLCAGVVAQLRGKYKWHDRFQAPVVILNIFFILFVMVPTFRAIAGEIPSGLAQTPIWVTTVHATLGTIAQLLGIYMFLAGFKYVPRKIGVLRYYMWTTFIFWTLTVLFGIGVYIMFYTGDSSAETATVAEHDADLAPEHAADLAEPAPAEAPAEEVVDEHAEVEVIPTEELIAGDVAVVEEHAAEIVEEPAATPAPTPTPAPVQVGLLWFSDGQAHGDQVNLELSGVTPPPAGSVYEVWLEAEGQEPVSVGRPTVTGDTITYTFLDPEGRNLLGIYDRMFISIEPAEDAEPAPSGTVAYRGSVAPDVIEPVRQAIVAAPDTADGDGYAFNARAELVESMALEVNFQQDYSIAEDDLNALKIQAEGILNVIEGANSPNFGDRDGSGDVYVPGASDQFGLLPYLVQVLVRVDAAAQAEGATPQVIQAAEQTRTAAQNSIRWLEEIQALEQQILQVASTAEAVEAVAQVVELTAQLQDASGAGLTDAGQGGILATYTFGQLMGGIEIFSQPVEVAPVATPELIDEHGQEIIDEHGEAVTE